MRYSAVTFGGSEMVSHKRLQQYKRYYGKTLMTGLYGCRWHRYQQSRDNTSIWDLGWFCALVLLFLFTLMWLFYWIAAFNSAQYINELISGYLGTWYDWHTVLLAVSTVTFGYVALLFFLALLHTGYGHEMYMHKVHKGVLLLVLTGCITATNCATSLWPQGWTLMYLSILASWPFIHITVVTVMTLLTLVIAKRWMDLYTIAARVGSLSMFLAVVVFLYISPILVQPPCVRNKLTLSSRPQLIAHRGGAALAPENTLLAFQRSNQYAQTFECDVQISMDGVPFLLRDAFLLRTTNVEKVFPDRKNEPAHSFNMSDLQTLDAGSWFLEDDPFDFVETPELVGQIKNQTIPTLLKILNFVKTTNKSIYLDIQPAPPAGHPYQKEYLNIIIDTIIESKINPQKILWTNYKSAVSNATSKFSRLGLTPPQTLQQLANDSVHMVNLPYQDTDADLFSMYTMNNVSVNIYTVDSYWLYSLCWCMGVSSVTTNKLEALSSLQKPVWIMSPLVYLIMWVVADVVSALFIVAIFVYYRVRRSGTIFNPETLSLQAMQHRISQTKQNRNMKEKLLYAAESIQDMENGISGVITPSTPATPATPATLETPTTPLSPTTPNLTIHGNGHHAGNISFSKASGFFGETSSPQHGDGRVEKPSSHGGGVYNEALSPKEGMEDQPGAPPNGFAPASMHAAPNPANGGVTETQVRGFFESPPLKTDHYRSLSDNFANGFIKDKELPPTNGVDQRPRSDYFIANRPPFKATHLRSNSATIPNTFFADVNGEVPRERFFSDAARSSSVNSNVSERETMVPSFGTNSVPSHLSQAPVDSPSGPAVHKETISHADISIEVA